MEYKYTNFMKIYCLFALFFVLNKSIAQQRIIFLEKIKGKEVMQNGQAYYLPKVVSCKINNERSKKLVLESVHGDTLHFKTPTLDSVVTSCSYQNIEFIRFHNKRFYTKKTIVACTNALTFLLSATTMVLLSKRNEISYNKQYIIISFITASVVSFITGATLDYKLPPKLNSKKYSLIIE